VPQADAGPARLVLYSRRYCHLCEEMLAALRSLDSELAVEIVDVDADPALEARFGEDVPVLMHGDRELSRHRLDGERVRAYLGRTG
jgi:Glutaredoxin-like domain (DUF836)